MCGQEKGGVEVMGRWWGGMERGGCKVVVRDGGEGGCKVCCVMGLAR